MALPGATPVLDPELSLQLLAAVVAGTALGTCTGLVPGLHANAVALVLVGAAPSVPAPPLVLASAVLSVGVAHTFLNAIPALAIGVPDAEMAVSALPGHRLVLGGRGREAIRLSVLGSALAVVAAVPIAVPVTAAMVRWYPLLAENLSAILAAVVVGLLAAEPTTRRRVVGATTFLLAAVLGWLTLDVEPAAPLSAGGVLAPLFAGLFGAPVLLEALQGDGVPTQADTAIRRSPGGVAATATAGAVAGALVGYLPGISAAIAAVAVLVALPGDVSDRGYVVATSGVDTSNAIFALLALWAIGKPRSGVVVAVEELGLDLHLPVLIGAVLLSGALAACVTLAVGDRYLRLVGSVDNRVVSVGVLALLVALSALLAGVAGVAVFAVATLVGLVPVRFGAYRVHCMGVLIGPLLVWT